MYCVHCGKEIKGDVRFCPNCGQKVKEDEIVENVEMGNRNSWKANSDSERQPTSALVLLGVAVLVFAYGIVCINDKSNEFETLGGIIVCVSMALGIAAYMKLKIYKERNGLNGIGYIAYLICKILLPILAILICFLIIGFVLIMIEMLL